MTLAQWLERSATPPARLAEQCGVHLVTIYKWRSGAIRPRAPQMAALARATGGAVTANDFVPGMVEQDHGRRPGMSEVQDKYVSEARTLGLDPDAIAAKALGEAIRAEKQRRWIGENRGAMDAWNAWTDENELPLAKYRPF